MKKSSGYTSRVRGIASFGYTEMQDREGSPPDGVRAAKELLGSSAGLLLVTPEHNYGVPGVLKNAVDWLSRPRTDSPLMGRPMALMGASTGYMGTIRAQMAWRQMWHFFRAPVFSDAEMTVAFAMHAFEGGRLTDAQGLERLDLFLGSLRDWLASQSQG